MELAPGLHRIGNDMVAVHLIVTDEGITLVDAGLPGHYRDLRAELGALGRSRSDIRGIVLTHGDSDHIGFAERLRRELDIPVYVGAGDVDRATGTKPPSPPRDARKLGPTLAFFAYAVRKGALRIPPLTRVEEVGDGDILDLPGSPRIMGMPGHSPGSIAVHVPAFKAVFVGDELTTRSVITGQTGPQPAPFTDDQARSSTSLARLTELDVDWIVPGHGPVWTRGSAALITVYREAEAARAVS